MPSTPNLGLPYPADGDSIGAKAPHEYMKETAEILDSHKSDLTLGPSTGVMGTAVAPAALHDRRFDLDNSFVVRHGVWASLHLHITLTGHASLGAGAPVIGVAQNYGEWAIPLPGTFRTVYNMEVDEFTIPVTTIAARGTLAPTVQPVDAMSYVTFSKNQPSFHLRVNSSELRLKTHMPAFFVGHTRYLVARNLWR